MSDPRPSLSAQLPARRTRDGGMTLPELLIAITVLGLITAVLSSAVIVTLRQNDNTEGRVNVARAEQSISMWLPADLASADTVDTSPSASPCGASTCSGIDLSKGSNVLMLTWTTDVNGTTVTTNVSYHFRESSEAAGTYELLRVECINGACTAQTVLKDLPGPPGGETFVPGVPNGSACAPTGAVACTRPTWVIIVSEPLAADATNENQIASETERKNANRVVVTINGGGDSSGAGGGINQISITAGGTVRSTIDANSIQGAPTFSQALSLCGGPMTLVIDESNSIGGAIDEVEDGVTAFIEALAGTPVRLQVVRFQTYSSILGSSQWHEYFDMTDPTDVQTLLDRVGDLQGSWPSDSQRRGGTNWEEALFRTFYNADGSTAAIIPETVVFFTDGVPTFDRLGYRSSPGILPAEPPAPVAPWPASTGSVYSQVAFNRANHIANAFRRSVRFIGVGVGSGITASSNWIVDPGAGYRNIVERAYRQYQRATSYTPQSNIDFERSSSVEANLDFEQASTFQSNLDFEQRVGSNWQNRTPTQYYGGNTTSDSTDGWRINGTRSWYNVTRTESTNWAALNPSNWTVADWTNVGPTAYYTGNVNSGSWDGFRINGTRSWYSATTAEWNSYRSLSPANWRRAGWADTTPTDYYAANTTADDTDGLRINGTRAWYTVTQAEYNARNTTPDATDGWQLSPTWGWITQAEYDAGNTTPDASDGFNDVGSPQYVAASEAQDWVLWTGAQEGDANQYRTTRLYNTPPYDAYEPAITAATLNSTILARLIAGNDFGTPGTPTGGPYTNTDIADMYVLPNWSQFETAMQQIALGECGGTLTLQTKVGGTTPARDPFTYQRAVVKNADDVVLPIEPSVVTTSQQFTTGTFDLPVDDGRFVTVEILPHQYSNLTAYTPNSWSCRAGITPRSFETIPLDGAWQGIRVQVAANEAVSCTLSVTKN